MRRSLLPFQTTYYLNGHSFVAGELQRQGVRFRKDDDAFLSTADLPALQAAADRLSPEILRQRLDYWTLVLGPKFSKKDRAAITLRRAYSLNRLNTAEISSSVAIFRSTRSSSARVSWACFV